MTAHAAGMVVVGYILLYAPGGLLAVAHGGPWWPIGTNDAPKFNGAVPVEAVGVALVYLRVGDSWECYEIPNVLVLPGCGATLYSTRVMRNEFGFDHQIDHGKIVVPGAHDIPVHDDGAAYTTQIAFVPFGAPRPHRVGVIYYQLCLQCNRVAARRQPASRIAHDTEPHAA